jgi:hypothetical protein
MPKDKTGYRGNIDANEPNRKTWTFSLFALAAPSPLCRKLDRSVPERKPSPKNKKRNGGSVYFFICTPLTLSIVLNLYPPNKTSKIFKFATQMLMIDNTKSWWEFTKGKTPEVTTSGVLDLIQFGGADGTRTRDLLTASQTFSQLNYGPRKSANRSHSLPSWSSIFSTAIDEFQSGFGCRLCFSDSLSVFLFLPLQIEFCVPPCKSNARICLISSTFPLHGCVD